MKDALKKLEQKKLMQERRYLKTDLEIKESIISENQSEFMQRAYEMIEKKKPEANKESESKDHSEYTWDSYSLETKDKAKKLYREISKKTHPDRDVNGLYTDIFAGAAEAYEKCNLFDLYDYCEQLNIQYKMNDEETESIKKDIEKKREKVKTIENSFAYLWSIHESEKMKELIIKQFIKTVGDKL
jgi:hypothetical protein